MRSRRAPGRRAAIVGLLILSLLSPACDRDTRRAAEQLTGGNPDRAPQAMRRYGCTSCHAIPGVDGANGAVGPPLASFGRRSYIAGHLSNDADTLVRWIRHPHALDPRTAMPEMGVSDQDARDIAAYLYTLR